VQCLVDAALVVVAVVIPLQDVYLVQKIAHVRLLKSGVTAVLNLDMTMI
jgi:hypothetical protein